MKKIILYHTNPLQFGGIDTFDYNFCKKMKKSAAGADFCAGM